MIDCKSRPVIYPRLARRLVVSEGRMVVTGRKRADFKLLELLTSSADLPHVMVWDTRLKRWEAYPDKVSLQIMDDVVVNYDYEKLISFQDGLLLSWLNLYSSAAFTIIQLQSRTDVALNFD